MAALANSVMLPFSEGAPLTMSSREIADLCGKEHKNVLSDIRKMLGDLGKATAEFSAVASVDGANNAKRQIEVFNLPKRETLILVSGYSIDLRARIIDRWQELESRSPVDPMAALNDPAAMRGLLLSYTEKVLSLQGEVEEMRPKTQALDRIADSEGSLCITDAAKTLQVTPKALFTFLRSNGWIYSRGGGAEIAYQDKLVSGLLEHKTTTVSRTDGSEKTVSQVRVTPKGLTRLARECPPVVRSI